MLQKIDELGPWHQKIKLSNGLTTPGGWDVKKQTELFEEMGVNFDNYKKIIDIGCNAGGIGHSLRLNSNYIGEYIGIEPDPKYYNQAKFIR